MKIQVFETAQSFILENIENSSHTKVKINGISNCTPLAKLSFLLPHWSCSCVGKGLMIQGVTMFSE